MTPTNVSVVTAPAAPEGQAREGVGWIEVARIFFVAVASAASWLGAWQRFASFDVIALSAMLVGSYPILREALSALLARRMTMELSMTIALAAAAGIGEFFTASVIVLFVLIAEVLGGLTVGRGRRAIKDLLDLLPRTAIIWRAGDTVEVRVGELRVEDTVIVRPGARIPVDGSVVSGHSFADQSAITGESVPVEKVPGAAVYAGTINQSGVLGVRVGSVGGDTTFGKIIEAVERADRSRAPVQKIADRLAGHLVYFAIGAAAVTFVIGRDVRTTISVVIVAGACGIAAGTPLAILGAIGRAARQGVIIKGGIYLETLAVVDTVLLDKTGTLTFGTPTVVEILPCPGVAPQAVLAAAAIAERPSEHPLGKALLAQAAKLAVAVAEPETFDYTPGKGVVCTLAGEEIVVGNRGLLAERGIDTRGLARSRDGVSEVLVARGARLLGAIWMADVLRPEAVAAIRALRAMGVRTELVTGDALVIATAIGQELGVDRVAAELLPEQKVARVRTLLAQGKTVAMIGDGINDAPALMQASVGVAMGSGTEVARESAPVVLLGNDLLKFVSTLHLARQCRRIIRQNFAGTLLVDGVGVGLAAAGLLNPLLAAFIHVTSELAFILNSARLLPPPAEPEAPCKAWGSATGRIDPHA